MVRARNHVIAAAQCVTSGARCLRRSRGEGDDLRALSGELQPAIFVRHVPADLNAEFSEITFEDWESVSRGNPAFEQVALAIADRMKLVINSCGLAGAIKEHGRIEKKLGPLAVYQRQWDHEVALIVARLPSHSLHFRPIDFYRAFGGSARA